MNLPYRFQEEPGEEAVERALERLLRIEPESDHVA